MDQDSLPELATVKEMARVGQCSIASLQHLLRTRRIREAQRIGPTKLYDRPAQERLLTVLAQVRRALPRSDGMALARERVTIMQHDLDTLERQAVEDSALTALHAEVDAVRTELRAVQAGHVWESLHKIDAVLGAVDAQLTTLTEAMRAMQHTLTTLGEHVGSHLLNLERRMQDLEDNLRPEVEDPDIDALRTHGRVFVQNVEADLAILQAMQAAKRGEN